MAAAALSQKGLSPIEDPDAYEAAWPEALEKSKAAVAAEHEEVVGLGGLYVLSTERHESRRIDNQLRGRSGRQGDPGESQFYLSLEDDLMRLFKSDMVDSFLRRFNVPDDVPIEAKMVTNAIRSAQSQVEAQNFEIRKDVLKYDDVLNRQRLVVYDERRRVLEGEDIEEQVRTFIRETVTSYVTAATGEGYPESWDLEQLWTALRLLYPVGVSIEDLEEEEERAAIDAVGGPKANWKIDLSGGIQRVAIKHGCSPFGNAKARCVVWIFPDPIPAHREPLYTPRRDLVADYPTYEDRKLYRLPTMYASIQAKDFSKDFPTILTSGRLVEYEGGGDETRSNPWLAELQQNMFVEINPRDANNAGIRDGDQVWVHGPEGGKVKVMALVTERVGAGVAFMPFHFGGHFQGVDQRSKYPEGADPYVLGESTNTAQTYGYDAVTLMQETKTTLCRVERA